MTRQRTLDSSRDAANNIGTPDLTLSKLHVWDSFSEGLSTEISEPSTIYRVSEIVLAEGQLSKNAVTTGTADACGEYRGNLVPIPLDSAGTLVDTGCNTLAAPLLRQVTGLRNDVHQGRVIFLRLSKLEGPR